MVNNIRGCLICEKTVEIEKDDIPTSIFNNKILFDSCLGILNIDEQSYNSAYSWKWDGDFDLPYFCSTCADDIALLSVFDEDLNIIKNEINEGIGKAKTAILSSTSDENRNLDSVVSNLLSSDDVPATTKFQYYRSCAVRDMNPHVSLSRLDKQKKTDTDGHDHCIMDLCETKEVVLTSREERYNYFIDFGEKFKCKICFAVITDCRYISSHIDLVHRKIKRYKCKYCHVKYPSISQCKKHVNKYHRSPKTISPLSLTKFYSKLIYLRNGDKNEDVVIQTDKPFIKPLIIKTEPTEENAPCLICRKYFENDGVQISSEVFASLSRSLKVSQWDQWKDYQNFSKLCAPCCSLANDLHFNQLKFEDTQRQFDKLLLKFKAKLILSTPVNTVETKSSLNSSISTKQKSNYFRKIAITEFTPMLRLFRTDSADYGSRKLPKWRAPRENSIYKLVKLAEIIVLNPELVDRSIPLTEEEIEHYFQCDGHQYLCRICGSNFTSYNSANTHVNIKHKHLNRFECKYCDMQFFQRFHCAYHIVSSHKMERAQIAAEIEKAITKSQSTKMTSADGVLKIVEEVMPPPLPPGSIIKEGNSLKCTICSGIYKSRTAIVSHQRVAHLKFHRFKCEFCQYKNYVRNIVVRHVRNVHREKLKQNGKNEFPSKRLTRPKLNMDPSSSLGVKALEVKAYPNIDNHITVADGQYRCKFCGKQFISRYSIVMHLEGVHFGVRRFQCEFCNIKCISFSHCKRHIAKTHRNGEKLCSNQVRDKNCQLLGHLEIDNKNENSEIPIQSQQAADIKEDFSMSADMEYSGGEELPIEIPVLKNLDIQVLPFTFENGDPFICKADSASGSNHYSSASGSLPDVLLDDEKTEKRTNSVSDARMAKSLIYGLIQPGNVIQLPKNPNFEEELLKGFKKTDKGFECLKCDNKILKRLKIFRMHWGTMHDKNGGFECSVCQKRFLSKFHCSEHYICKHTDFKPYTCNICERSFGNNQSLENHVKLHGGERPFECSACPLKFTSSKVLQTHCKIQHMKILGA